MQDLEIPRYQSINNQNQVHNSSSQVSHKIYQKITSFQTNNQQKHKVSRAGVKLDSLKPNQKNGKSSLYIEKNQILPQPFNKKIPEIATNIIRISNKLDSELKQQKSDLHGQEQLVKIHLKENQKKIQEDKIKNEQDLTESLKLSSLQKSIDQKIANNQSEKIEKNLIEIDYQNVNQNLKEYKQTSSKNKLNQLIEGIPQDQNKDVVHKLQNNIKTLQEIKQENQERLTESNYTVSNTASFYRDSRFSFGGIKNHINNNQNNNENIRKPTILKNVESIQEQPIQQSFAKKNNSLNQKGQPDLPLNSQRYLIENNIKFRKAVSVQTKKKNCCDQLLLNCTQCQCWRNICCCCLY